MRFYNLKRSIQRSLSEKGFSIKKYYRLARGLVSLAGLADIAVRPPGYKTWDHALECGGHKIPVRIFSPGGSVGTGSPGGTGEPNTLGLPVILFFHGGGWVIGNIDSYTGVCAQLAHKTGHMVVSVDYCLAPEHKFPHGLNDCYAAASELMAHAQEFGVRPEEIVLMGDSAGANLAAAVSLMARDKGEFRISRQVLIYPAVYHDHSPSSPFASVNEYGKGQILTAENICEYIELYKNSDEDLKSPYFAPLNAESYFDQPETLIITAELDPLRDEGEEYGRRLAKAGNAVQVKRIRGAMHGFFSAPPSADPALEACYLVISEFLGRDINAEKGKE